MSINVKYKVRKNHTRMFKSHRDIRAHFWEPFACKRYVYLGFNLDFELQVINILHCSSIPVHIISSYLETETEPLI